MRLFFIHRIWVPMDLERLFIMEMNCDQEVY